MKKCELCSHIARIHCLSDNASLCYTCDQTVHSSNFLVAKHSRTLLCHKCQSPTPWTASGLDLGRAATVCVTCLDEDTSQRHIIINRQNDVVVEDNHNLRGNEETDTEDTEDAEDMESSDDEDAENQVVPWSSVVTQPVTGGCSSSEDVSSSRVLFEGFRSVTCGDRLDAYIDSSEDDTVCSSERFNGKRSREIALTSFRPLKVIRSDRN